jgi:hypothetical protein
MNLVGYLSLLLLNVIVFIIKVVMSVNQGHCFSCGCRGRTSNGLDTCHIIVFIVNMMFPIILQSLPQQLLVSLLLVYSRYIVCELTTLPATSDCDVKLLIL